MTMVHDSPDVKAVLEGADECSPRFRRDSLIVDCTHRAAVARRRLAARATELGSAMIDAPVSGGEVAPRALAIDHDGGDAPAVRTCAAGAEAMATKNGSCTSHSGSGHSARSATRW